MQYIFALLCLLIFKSGQATEFTPTLLDPPPVEVPPLNISQEDIAQALLYAREQRDIRIQEEDNYVKAGHNISKSELSRAARSFAPMLPKSMMLHRSRIQLEDATQWIAQKYNLTEDQITLQLPKTVLPRDNPVIQECLKLQETPPCNASAKYRTADGTCNNLDNPIWGSAPSCYRKLLTPAYDDKFSSPRFHEGSSVLPNVRLISTTISQDVNLTSRDFTQMVMSVGQFIAHDTIQSAHIGSGKELDIPDCCSSIKRPQYCMDFDIPTNDYYFSKLNRTCIGITRASSCSSDCKLGSPRHQVNQFSAFLDGSQIYGASLRDTLALRSMQGGALKNQETKYGEFLPLSFFPEIDQCSKGMDNNTCFQAGDYRAMVHPGIVSMHMVFLRLHNRIAKAISRDYPQATDEEVFQETRRIIGAYEQVVVYRELLPMLVGPTLMNYFQLNVLDDGFTTYDPDINPSAFSEYAGACTRYGHTAIQKYFQKFAENNVQEDGDEDITESFFHPQCFYDGKMDSIIRGLFHQGEQKFDRHFISYLTNHLMEVLGKGDGGDLVAVNIQRGRDIGLPSYTKVFHYCYNVTISSFEELSLTMDEESWKALQQAYSHVDEIDLYPGGLSERPIEDSVLGPTFACILGKQFHNLKYGDRFYFEHKDQAGSFTEGQLKEIRKTTLAQIICTNTEIREITPNPFRTINGSNAPVDCQSLESAVLTKWLEK